MASARSWIETDNRSIRDDIFRLGLAKAATYNMGLLRERISDGETRWKGITRAEMLSALRELKEQANPNRRKRNAGTSTASRTATRTATEATTTGNKTSTSTGGASTSGGNVSISVKHNPASRVGGKGLTLRNMAVITIQRLPGGAVKVSGRKMAGGRANPGSRKSARELRTYQVWDDGGCQYTLEADSVDEAAEMAREWMESQDYSDGETSGEFTVKDHTGKVVYSGTFDLEAE